MILVDTSIWVDHLRERNPSLVQLLESNQILAHPFVIGELALGNLRQRGLILQMLQALPRAIVASDLEVLQLIERNRLFSSGIGYIDAHLLAAAQLTAGSALWTRDQQLRSAAVKLALAADI